MLLYYKDVENEKEIVISASSSYSRAKAIHNGHMKYWSDKHIFVKAIERVRYTEKDITKKFLKYLEETK